MGGARQSMTVRQKRSSSLTPLELRMMKVLWEVGPASVKVVQQNLCPRSELAYTSVHTVLNILQQKGKVKRTLQGRAYEYCAVVSHEDVSAAMLHGQCPGSSGIIEPIDLATKHCHAA